MSLNVGQDHLGEDVCAQIRAQEISFRKQTPLWATPRAKERGAINIEFRLSETACGDQPTRVGHLL
jgi:hypothetical protein